MPSRAWRIASLRWNSQRRASPPPDTPSLPAGARWGPPSVEPKLHRGEYRAPPARTAPAHPKKTAAKETEDASRIRPEQTRPGRRDTCPAGRGRSARAALLDGGARAGMRLQVDFAEGGFVLRDVLRQDVVQRLGLLRAEIDALKVVYEDVVGRGLVDHAEAEQEVPQVHPHLHAVGVALPVIGCVVELDFRLLGRLGVHTLLWWHSVVAYRESSRYVVGWTRASEGTSAHAAR